MRTSHPSWIGPRAHQQVAVVPLPVLCVGGSLDIGSQRHPRVIWANQPVSSVNSGFLANLAKSSRTLLCLRIHSAGVIGPVARQNQTTLCELYASVLPNVEFLEPWETETLPARPALPCQGHCFVGPSMRRALHQSCWPPRDDAHSTAAQRPSFVPTSTWSVCLYAQILLRRSSLFLVLLTSLLSPPLVVLEERLHVC